MEEIGYSNWGLIAFDPEPTNMLEPYLPNPPMLTTVALDPGACLIFLLRAQPTSLQVIFEVTSVSAEGHSPHLFKVYTGTSGTEFSEIQCQDWSKQVEGMYTTFSTVLEGVQPYVKFLAIAPPPLIVNRITFSG